MSMSNARDFAPHNDDISDHVPANVEAEQALLGACLYDNGAVERITEALQAEHFHEPFHGRLFQDILLCVRAGKLAEPILMAEKFRADPAFEELGGVRYLADLVDRAPPAANAPDYAETILDLAKRRRLILACHEGLRAATSMEETAQAHIEAVESVLFELAENKGSSEGLVPLNVALSEAVQMAAAAYERDGGLSGLSTGLMDLDQKTGGLHPSDLVIIAARPSMGKSALAMNIAWAAASQYAYEPQPDGGRKTVRGGQVAFFSLEMSQAQLAMRLLAEVAGVSGDRIRKGDINAGEFGRIRDAAMEIQDAPLHIDDTGGLSIAKLAARARRMKRRQGLDLVIVDYLQLVTSSKTRKGDNRVQEVSEITQALKALAKELAVPVIALSQLSRQVENREDKKPQLADLRESGSIEQDADMVMFIYREAYYLSRTEPKEGTDEHFRWREQMDIAQGVADVIIGKQRHGPIGNVKLAFNEDITKFGNLAREWRHGGGSPGPGEQRLAFKDE